MTEITSKEIASLAGHVLADPDASPEAKRLAGSALTQYETREPVEQQDADEGGVKTCVWTQGDDLWDTGCLNKHAIIDGTPKNGMMFCCYCNKPIIAARKEQLPTTAEQTQQDYKRMFESAVSSIAEISIALGISDDDAFCANGNELILDAINDLKAQQDAARKEQP